MTGARYGKVCVCLIRLFIKLRKNLEDGEARATSPTPTSLAEFTHARKTQGLGMH